MPVRLASATAAQCVLFVNLVWAACRCAWVWVRVGGWVDVHARPHVCVNTYVNTHVCVNTYVNTYVWLVRKHVRVGGWVDVHARPHVCVRVCVFIARSLLSPFLCKHEHIWVVAAGGGWEGGEGGALGV